MSDMKCPFCNTPLVHENMSDYWCVHCNTQEQKGLYGSDKLWQELIRTRKALDVARHTIGWVNQMIDERTDKQAIKIKCEYALEQITALEQKDIK